MESDRLKENIRREAKALGFSAIGFARFERVPSERLETWLNKGYQGKMACLERNVEKRLDPSRILVDVRTIICVRMDYCHSSSQIASTWTPTRVSISSPGVAWSLSRTTTPTFGTPLGLGRSPHGSRPAMTWRCQTRGRGS